MWEFLSELLDTSDFPARWHCGDWSDAHGWLHVISDLGVWSAYMAIPMVLVYYVRRRRDVLFPRVFLLFGAFIFACGTGHLIEASIFWWPAYRLAGLVKLLTAVISWVCVFVLVRIAPKAMQLPGILALNDELTRRNHELDEFAHIVSHDLKAPLRAISSLAEWIVEDNKDKLTGESREHLELLMGRIDRLNLLVDSVLEYARVGRARMERETVEFGALTQEVIDSLAVPKGVSIKVRGGGTKLTGIRVHLIQVLQNLISNAIEHMGRDDGHVEVTCVTHPEHWAITVADDGIGIAPEHHERIFQMFQSLREGSTGVGLAVVKKIATLQGGAVTIDSSPGQGARFTVTIPMRPHLSSIDSSVSRRSG